MYFRTEITTKKEHDLINHTSDIILIGSCFSDNIGNKLDCFKFKTLVNPYGVIFNPIAIENAITQGINSYLYTKEDLYFYNDIWFSFHHHTKFSNNNPEKILDTINSSLSSFRLRLKKASHVIVTLGTAWVYRFLETDNIVANCHKMPQKKFVKELLTVDEIIESLEASIALLKSFNNDVMLIFTVSPIRHLKDGFIENQQSKSHLIAAVHSVIDARKKISYFPSYEIMIDDLRDYRFYTDDMLHPNTTAINYIWDKFTATWMSDSTIKIMSEIDIIQKSLAHKPFNPTSKKHQDFLKKIEIDIAKLIKKYPDINF